IDRNSANWGLPPKGVQRRCILFWVLLVADAWNGLNTGRPPLFSSPYVDCLCSLVLTNRSFGIVVLWGKYAAECVAEVATRTSTAAASTYAVIMEIDHKVCEFPIPD
ncbi:hypothetical protein F4604DRAFT_1512317, partial [Suillus subluteus]